MCPSGFLAILVSNLWHSYIALSLLYKHGNFCWSLLQAISGGMAKTLTPKIWSCGAWGTCCTFGIRFFITTHFTAEMIGYHKCCIFMAYNRILENSKKLWFYSPKTFLFKKFSFPFQIVCWKPNSNLYACSVSTPFSVLLYGNSHWPMLSKFLVV